MSNKTLPLFDDLKEQFAPVPINLSGLDPIWTAHKADFVARYLKNFTWVTKHGCYIDGFSGPRLNERVGEETWAAKLVLENRPAWLRQFHLCDADPSQIAELKKLVEAQPEIKNRTIQLHSGDFNDVIFKILETGDITPKTATFALLDQYTCQCNWKTVKMLAEHKPSGSNKIELLYFLATGWLHRSLSKFNSDIPTKWWGNDDWKQLTSDTGNLIAIRMTERFRDELGYKYSNAYPIFSKPKAKGRVMFHLIHATDHDVAPKLMAGAYRQVIRPTAEQQQIDMVLEAKYGDTNHK